MPPPPAGARLSAMNGDTDHGWEELRPPLDAQYALLAAERCLECGGVYAEAPCTVACPADVDVPRFITALAERDVAGAARTIYDANILGGTCSRVCPVEVLCEGACVLAHEGRKPVEIGRLQRYATDEALARGLPVRERAAGTGKRVAVIGAGPAGLACAGELASRGHDVTVYDERDEVGGLARFAIAPYRIEEEPLADEAHALERLAVAFRLATPIDTPEQLRELEAEHEAVFLGIGLGDDVDMRYEGDDRHGVWSSLRFIERLKRRPAAAWAETFDAFLAQRAEGSHRPFVPFHREHDYVEHVGGTPRLDGVRAFLASRGISLPEGTRDDAPGAATV